MLVNKMNCFLLKGAFSGNVKRKNLNSHKELVETIIVDIIVKNYQTQAKQSDMQKCANVAMK